MSPPPPPKEGGGLDHILLKESSLRLYLEHINLKIQS
jgi:hypothetical protein